MYSELIVLVKTGQEDLDNSWQFLETKHAGGLLKLIDIVLISHDTTGNISFQMRWKEIDRLINNHSQLAGAFAEAIFDLSRTDDRHQLVAAGLDPFFVRKVTQALIQDSSAYLLHVSRESLIDSRGFLEVLEAQQGDIYHTTFRPQVEEVLLNLDD